MSVQVNLFKLALITFVAVSLVVFGTCYGATDRHAGLHLL